MVIALIIIIAVMIKASAGGYLPNVKESEWSYSHGPWRYTFLFYESPIYKLRIGLSSAFLFLIYSAISSFLSIFFKLNRANIVIFTGSFVILWLSFYYLYWLID